MKQKEFNKLNITYKKDIADWYINHTGRSTKSKFNLSSKQLKDILVMFNISEHTKAQSMELGMLEKYGVTNITHSEHYKNKIKSRTNESRDAITLKRKQTNMKKYGFEHVLQVPEIRDKQQATCEERYGVSNFAQLDNFSDILHERNLKKWGIEHPMKLDLYKQIYKEILNIIK